MFAQYQHKLNLTFKEELDSILCETNQWNQYLHKYWYSLKYFTHSLHGVYTLLNRLLVLHGYVGMGKQSPYHNLVYTSNYCKQLQDFDTFDKLCVTTD